jgi:SCP-2 sterol transfer family protein
VATTRQIEAKLHELIARLDGASSDVHGSLAGSLPDGKVVEVHLTDLDTSYWTQMAKGKMSGLSRGAPERADIRLSVESDRLIELIDGHRSVFSAYVAGELRLEASLSDLLRLRRLS